MSHPFVKLGLYVVVLAILEFGTRAASYTAADVAGWQPWDWIVFASGIAGAVALFIRGFIDRSWGDHQDEQDAGKPDAETRGRGDAETKTLLVLVMCGLGVSASGQAVKESLQWDPSLDTNCTSYCLYYTPLLGGPTNRIALPLGNTATVNVSAGRNIFWLTAINDNACVLWPLNCATNRESLPSNTYTSAAPVVVVVIPSRPTGPTNLRAAPVAAREVLPTATKHLTRK